MRPRNTVDISAPGFPVRPDFSLVASPHADGDNAWRSTFGTHRICENIASTGAGGKHFTRIIGKRVRTAPASLMFAGVIGISSPRAVWHMRQHATDHEQPATFAIILACRGNHRCIDTRTRRQMDGPGLELACDLLRQRLVRAVNNKAAAKPDEGGAFSCRLQFGDPAESKKRCTIIQSFGKPDI